MVGGSSWLLALLLLASGALQQVQSDSLLGAKAGAIRGIQDRSLQACNDIVVTWTVEELAVIAENAIDESLGVGSFEGMIAKSTLLPALTHGVQVRRLCASCSDFPVKEQPEAFAGFCTDYGSEVAHSGLFMIPVSSDGSFLAGTHTGAIYCHGTSTQSVPSTEFRGENSAIDIMLNVAIASTGTVVLLPDYMGYGISSNLVYKAYLVKQQYQTSVVPLWLMAEKVLQEESNCATALADAAAVVGYSEGAYAAVAIAEALHSMNIDILKVEAGGGPYRTGSAVILETVRNIDSGVFPEQVRHYLALFGSAYSSTYPALANFEWEQDMLSEDSRDTIVGLITRSASEDVVRAAIPVDDPMSIFWEDLVEFVREAIAAGDSDPCANGVVPGFNDKLCEALVDNDLTTTLETTPYRVRVCHSPDDEVVSSTNLPDAGSNDLLDYIPASGNHVEAGATCLLHAMSFLLSSAFQDAPVTEKHMSDACLSGALPAEPTAPPSQSNATETPSASPSATESAQPTIDESAVPSLPPTSTWKPTQSPSPTSSPYPSASPSAYPTEGPLPEYECGEILSSWNAEEAKSLLLQVAGDMYGQDSQEYLDVDESQSLVHGVQVRKICASCGEFSIFSDNFNEYCGVDAYGHARKHSGLAMLPLTPDGSLIASGTFPGIIHNHKPTVSRVPSNTWNGQESSVSEIMLGVLPAAAGSVVIFPDYFGYGETNAALYKAFLIKKAYQTSIVPLWLKAKDILEQESSNCAALADAVTVAGFHEGGYASVSVADALYDLGVDIVRVHAGAVPAKIGSVLIPDIVQSVDSGDYPLDERFALALLGSAYSASYPDLLNVEEGPYLLDASVLEQVVDVVMHGASASSVERLVPVDDMLSIFNRQLIAWARAFNEGNATEPCEPSDSWSDLFCATLAANDLSEILENSLYPVTLCHSADDTVVSTSNLPRLKKNGNVTVSMVDGTHAESSVVCESKVLDYLKSADYLSHPVVAKHSEDEACATPVFSTNLTSSGLEGTDTNSKSAGYHKGFAVGVSMFCMLAFTML